MQSTVQEIDIAQKLGKISTMEKATALFQEKLDVENQTKINLVKHPRVLIKIANAIAMCEPDRVFVKHRLSGRQAARSGFVY